MDTNERRRLALAVTALGEAYRQQVSAATIHAYEMGLDDMPVAAIESAVRRAMRERKFMPTVAEIRELAGELTPADRAVIAWKAVKDADASHGHYGSVCFDDPAINAALRAMGGWERLDERLEAEGEVWVAKEFDRVYQVYVRRGVTADEGAALGGFHARMNAVAFPEHAPGPVLIRTTLKPTPFLGGAKHRLAITAPVAGFLANIGAMPEGSK